MAIGVQTQPNVHDEAVEANVEVVIGTLTELRRGLQLIGVEPEAGAKIVVAQADILSKAISSLSMQISHLHAPAKRDDGPPAPVISLRDAFVVGETLEAVLENKFCTTCGLYR